MAAWSSALDCGAQSVVKYYYRGYRVGIRVRVTIMIRVKVRIRVRVRVNDGVWLGLDG